MYGVWWGERCRRAPRDQQDRCGITATRYTIFPLEGSPRFSPSVGLLQGEVVSREDAALSTVMGTTGNSWPPLGFRKKWGFILKDAVVATVVVEPLEEMTVWK